VVCVGIFGATPKLACETQAIPGPLENVSSVGSALFSVGDLARANKERRLPSGERRRSRNKEKDDQPHGQRPTALNMASIWIFAEYA
jgi:hypothetical protein